ncbi:MAG: hypothetical protein HZB53_19810 [Chloroflexi bacterium]|nr:hypothetical protein [Chloroflexota bacterium]
MKLNYRLPLFATLMLLAVLISACGPSASRALSLAPLSTMPATVQGAPQRVREAYQFAVANPDALKNVPCYCGCGAMGHKSNLDCYLKDASAAVFDEHALGCSICVDITGDVMRMTREGRAPPDIRATVMATYARFGPPNQ